ncbi:MAG: class C sortase [Clostridiaceae bacterium]
MDKKKREKFNAKNGNNIIIAVIFILGLGIFSYPLVSNFINSRNQSIVIDNYQKELDKKSEEQKRKDLEEKIKNSLGLNTEDENIEDPFSKSQENDNPNLTMLGYIKIPKIGQEIPIYEGTSDYVLQNGIGHLRGTSLPIGGSGTHCVLSGHRGLPEAKLFSDLPELTYGDEFYITSEAGTIAYSVDQILTVLPTDIEPLLTVPDKDYVTLITCTPYMINSHRLLVRGHRVPYNPEVVKKEDSTHRWEQLKKYFFISISVILLVILLLIIKLIRKIKAAARKKREVQKNDSRPLG